MDGRIWGIVTNHQNGGGVIITKFCIRVKVRYLMICAIYGFSILRFTDSVGLENQGFPSNL